MMTSPIVWKVKEILWKHNRSDFWCILSEQQELEGWSKGILSVMTKADMAPKILELSL